MTLEALLLTTRKGSFGISCCKCYRLMALLLKTMLL
jgi:hypothetical protein